MSKDKEKSIAISGEQEKFLRDRAKRMDNHALAKKFEKEFGIDLEQNDIAKLRLQLSLPPSPKAKKDFSGDPRIAFLSANSKLTNAQLVPVFEKFFGMQTKPDEIEELRKKLKKHNPTFRRWAEKKSAAYVERAEYGEGRASDDFSASAQQEPVESAPREFDRAARAGVVAFKPRRAPAPAAEPVKEKGPSPVEKAFANLQARQSKSADFDFEPQYVTDPVKDQKYYYPGLGPVVCEGSETIEILGTKTTVVSFKQIYPENSGATVLKVDASQIENKGIRELTTPAQIDQAFYVAGTRGNPLKRVGENSTKREMDLLVNSPDLSVVAGAVAPLKEKDITRCNKALHFLAAEYAIVHGEDFGVALGMAKRAAKIQSLAELNATVKTAQNFTGDPAP